MFNWLFKKKPDSQLGIDMGSSSIKIVELANKDNRINLVNYALAQYKPDSELELKIANLKEDAVAEIIKGLLQRAGFKSKYASISLPVDRTFSVVIEMPAMQEEELAAAILFEAQKYIPISLSEVVLDWSIIANPESKLQAQELKAIDGVAQKNGAVNQAPNIQILLVAVPNEIIEKTSKIAKLAGLKVVALEQEAFSLVRALIGNDKSVFLIAEMGKKSVDLIIADNGFIRLSHNLEAGSKEVILEEIERVINLYQLKNNKKVEQCILAGGRAGEKELIDLFVEKLKIPIKTGVPFARVAHQPALDSFLKELGPQLAVAAGLAMRG